MTQPILFRSSIPITTIRVLQTIVPALAVAVTLRVVAGALGMPFDDHLLMLATLASVLSFFLFWPHKEHGPPLNFSVTECVLEAGLRWLATLGILYLIDYITGFASGIADRLLMTWAAVAGISIVLIHVLLQLAERGTVFSRENERTAVIVGVNTSSLLLASRLAQHPEYLTRVLGFFDDRDSSRLEPTGRLSVLGKLGELVPFAKREGVDIIFIALPLRHIQRVVTLLDELRDSTASVYYLPDVFVSDLIQSRSWDVDGVPVIAMCETPLSGYRGVMKRMTDLTFATMILLCALPFMIVIALLVKLTSKGPVIFKQRRYGLDGEEILVYKFRSMSVTEDGHDVKQAQRQDSRVTPLGRLLRKTSLDELPQLINVLQGRMSLVGPRPHAVAHNEQYRRLIAGYMLRHKVLPGITGLAQVNGCRGETAELEQMQARVNYDLDYLRQWTPFLDLRILVRTVFQMVRGDRRAY